MILLPAIDLYEEKAVRLYKGDYAQMTVYSDQPLQVAKDFAAAGASWIHMVDLQGARDGGTPHLELAAAVAEETCLQIEIGGGIRSLETAEKYLQTGVAREGRPHRHPRLAGAVGLQSGVFCGKNAGPRRSDPDLYRYLPGRRHARYEPGPLP